MTYDLDLRMGCGMRDPLSWQESVLCSINFFVNCVNFNFKIVRVEVPYSTFLFGGEFSVFPKSCVLVYVKQLTEIIELEQYLYLCILHLN